LRGRVARSSHFRAGAGGARGLRQCSGMTLEPRRGWKRGGQSYSCRTFRAYGSSRSTCSSISAERA
jgi:hypothetical protein